MPDLITNSTLLKCLGISLVAGAVIACGDNSIPEAQPSEEWPIDVSSGLRVPEHGPVPPLPIWADNPVTEPKKRLGEALYFDIRLSGSGNSSCPACHANIDEYQSGLAIDVPDRVFPDLGPSLTRNAPSLLNIVYASVFRWDGSHGTDLYEQMVLPYAEPNMNLTPGIPSHDVETVDVPLAQVELKRRLTEVIPAYVDWYQDAFEEDIRAMSAEHVWTLTGKALAIYIRRAVSRDSPFDRWNAGDDEAMDEAAVRGLRIFLGKGACSSCHSGPLFSDGRFHNLSLSLPDENGNRPDEGRYKVTGKEEDRGAFLTPMLRSVTQTAPYFHTGKVASIRKVIRHITSDAAKRDPLYSRFLDQMQELTPEETNDLVAFLKALRGADLPFELTDPPDADEMP